VLAVAKASGQREDGSRGTSESNPREGLTCGIDRVFK
jgi:hypothetical protein